VNTRERRVGHKGLYELKYSLLSTSTVKLTTQRRLLETL